MTFTLQDALKRETRLARKEASLLERMERKAGPRRTARLADIQADRAANQVDIDVLTGMQDQVSYELIKNDNGDYFGLDVTITDSIFDETFEGGKRSRLFISGSNDGSSFGLFTSLSPTTFAEGTETFTSATSTLVGRLDGSFDVTVSLVQGDNTIFTETLI